MKIELAFGAVKASSIRQTALVPEVRDALLRWIKTRLADNEPTGVLIGGLALGLYARPRQTQDVDLLFLSPSDVPVTPVTGFKRHRTGAFQDNRTQVELEIVTPQSVGLPEALVRKVFDTAVTVDNLKVASLEGMIALKLWGAVHPKRRLRDLADIQAMIESNPEFELQHMQDWKLSRSQTQQLKSLINLVRNEE